MVFRRSVIGLGGSVAFLLFAGGMDGAADDAGQ